MKYHKVGGLHWINIGRLRLMWCIIKPPKLRLPRATTLEEIIEQNATEHSVTHDFTTWNPTEHNHYIF